MHLRVLCFGRSFYFNLQKTILHKAVWMAWTYNQVLIKLLRSELHHQSKPKRPCFFKPKKSWGRLDLNFTYYRFSINRRRG